MTKAPEKKPPTQEDKGRTKCWVCSRSEDRFASQGMMGALAPYIIEMFPNIYMPNYEGPDIQASDVSEDFNLMGEICADCAVTVTPVDKPDLVLGILHDLGLDEPKGLSPTNSCWQCGMNLSSKPYSSYNSVLNYLMPEKKDAPIIRLCVHCRMDSGPYVRRLQQVLTGDSKREPVQIGDHMGNKPHQGLLYKAGGHGYAPLPPKCNEAHLWSVYFNTEEAPERANWGRLYLSSERGGPNITPSIDIGVFLSGGWDKWFPSKPVSPVKRAHVGGMGIEIPVLKADPVPHFPDDASIAILEWPDMAPAPPHMFKYAEWVADNIRKGYTVQTGCYGGHGRTGTFACMVLMTLLGWTAKDALAWVRKNYCTEAVETRGQEDSLADYEKYLHGTGADGAEQTDAPRKAVE